MKWQNKVVKKVINILHHSMISEAFADMHIITCKFRRTSQKDWGESFADRTGCKEMNTQINNSQNSPCVQGMLLWHRTGVEFQLNSHTQLPIRDPSLLGALTLSSATRVRLGWGQLCHIPSIQHTKPVSLYLLQEETLHVLAFPCFPALASSA